MKKDISKRISYAGVMTAISVIALVASFYINKISVALSFISVFCLVVLLSRGYLREAVLSYLATGIVAFFLGGLPFCFPYLVFYGAYTLLAYILNKYIKIKVLTYIIKAVYGVGVVLIGLLALKLFASNVIVQTVSAKPLYFALFTLGAVILLLLYDLALEKLVYSGVESLLKRINPTEKKKEE